MANVGIEIEVESRSVSQRDIRERILDGSLQTWELDPNEGSLRGGSYGWEIRTTGQGIPFGTLGGVLGELYPVLGDSTGVWRSAVHVHVDVRERTPYQRALALALAYVADYDIFRQVSPEREESNFCVPLENKTAQVTREVVRMASGGPPGGYGKYSSVNILPMRTFGTMEFRHMRTPECDNTVPSVRQALDQVRHFASLAHSVVTLGDMMPAPTSYDEVLSTFTALAHNRFIWRDIDIVPRKEASLAIMLALTSRRNRAEPALRTRQDTASLFERYIQAAEREMDEDTTGGEG